MRRAHSSSSAGSRLEDAQLQAQRRAARRAARGTPSARGPAAADGNAARRTVGHVHAAVRAHVVLRAARGVEQRLGVLRASPRPPR